MTNVGASPARASYRRAVEAEEIIDRTRERLAHLVGAKYPSQIVFTHNATDALNMAIYGVLVPGDHVVATVAEHNSVIRPLHKLQSGGGVEVSWIPCDVGGYVSAEQIARAVRANTKLIVATHASNVTGTVQPIGDIQSVAMSAGCLLLVDASQTVGHIGVNVQTLGADLLAFSGHKGLWGPPGTGALYIRPGVNLAPYRVGGTGVLSELVDQPDALPLKFESGTPNTVGLAGLGAGVEEVLAAGIDRIRSHEEALTIRLLDGLRAIDGVRVYGHANELSSVGTISFNVGKHAPSRVGFVLDKAFDVQVRTGLHCAPMIHGHIGSGSGGTVRISVQYHTPEDAVDRVLEGIRFIAAKTAAPLRIPGATA